MLRQLDQHGTFCTGNDIDCFYNYTGKSKKGGEGVRYWVSFSLLSSLTIFG
jgi:hypothetical protein